jgi:hypothetical protein
MGYLYQRKQRNGTIDRPYWIKYYVNGRPIRESTGTADYSKAKRVLKDREGARRPACRFRGAWTASAMRNSPRISSGTMP